MMELELMLNDLDRLHAREKGLRKRIYLEQAISALREYEKQLSFDGTRNL